MMGRLLLLFLVLIALLCGCADQASKTDPTTEPTVPTTTPEPEQELDLAYWGQFSDYELLEKAIESETIIFRQLSAVHMTAEEWKDFVLARCTPIRALMLRDTAFASVAEHAADLVAQHEDDPTKMRVDNFVLFVVTLYPELEQQFGDYEYTWP